jgi:hypothetical protein
MARQKVKITSGRRVPLDRRARPGSQHDRRKGYRHTCQKPESK